MSTIIAKNTHFNVLQDCLINKSLKSQSAEPNHLPMTPKTMTQIGLTKVNSYTQDMKVLSRLNENAAKNSFDHSTGTVFFFSFSFFLKMELDIYTPRWYLQVYVEWQLC